MPDLIADARSLLARRARDRHTDPDLLDVARGLLVEVERLGQAADRYEAAAEAFSTGDLDVMEEILRGR